MTTKVVAIQGTVLDCNPRCWACSRILIDYVTRPWGGLICKRSRCKAINSSEQRRCPSCGHLLDDGLSCLHCPPKPESLSCPTSTQPTGPALNGPPARNAEEQLWKRP